MNNRYLYVFYMPEFDYYKIGFSNDPSRRFKGIETSIPFELRTVFYVKDEDSSTIETSLHSQYSEYRIKGEWFYLNISHRLECIALILSNYKCSIVMNDFDNDIFINTEWLNESIKEYNFNNDVMWENLYNIEYDFLNNKFGVKDRGEYII